ncbi:MAG: heavy-metal-associated domain-containing protein [Rubricella sp.]
MTKFHVPDMTCGHCKAAIEKSLSAMDPSAKVDIDLDTHTVEVRGSAVDDDVLAALKKAGYEASVA